VADGLLSDENTASRLQTTDHGRDAAEDDHVQAGNDSTFICPQCGGPMLIVEIFERGQRPRAPPSIRHAA
jgi:hypothetical protein